MIDSNRINHIVVHPRYAGGGILAAVLSLDSRTADLSFTRAEPQEKYLRMMEHLQGTVSNAHAYGNVNIANEDWYRNLEFADDCERYVHKGQFHAMWGERNRQALDSLHNKKAIGIYLTDQCVEALNQLRPNTRPDIDYYQTWVYSNLSTLLPNYIGIQCLHTMPFIDLLSIDRIMEHIGYCQELLDLDVDLDWARTLAQTWQNRMAWTSSNH